MKKVFEPKMTFEKASEIWCIINQSEVLRGFFRSLEMTNEFIKISDLPLEEEKLTECNIWMRRGSFFDEILYTEDLTWNQKRVVIDCMIDLLPGVFIAWKVTNLTLKDILEDGEISNLAYFLHRLAVVTVNNYPGKPSYAPTLIENTRDSFDGIRRCEDGNFCREPSKTTSPEGPSTMSDLEGMGDEESHRISYGDLA